MSCCDGIFEPCFAKWLVLGAYFCFLLQLVSWVCVILWALVFFVSTSAQSGNLLFPLCTKETGGGGTRVHFCFHRNP